MKDVDFETLKNLTAEELAVELRRAHGYNCCESVTAALTKDPNMVLAAAGFGGGMGNMQGPCGALVGAVIAAGKKTDGVTTIRVSRQLYDNFKERSGAVICRELKGIDTGKVLCPCENCVRNAVRAYQEVFGE